MNDQPTAVSAGNSDTPISLAVPKPSRSSFHMEYIAELLSYYCQISVPKQSASTSLRIIPIGVLTTFDWCMGTFWPENGYCAEGSSSDHFNLGDTYNSPYTLMVTSLTMSHE